MVRRILDFAHFKLRSIPRQQGERDLSVEVKFHQGFGVMLNN